MNITAWIKSWDWHQWVGLVLLAALGIAVPPLGIAILMMACIGFVFWLFDLAGIRSRP